MATDSRFSTIAGTIAQGQVQSGEEEDREQAEQVDFKMVTFSLGGKDYAVDIMTVKEIAKFGNFTYVPNTMHFVRGVYNLRGEIISVIDLRRMFGVPVEDEEKELESGLIVRVDEHLIGVVVDSIDRVVGISSSQVQPPHPIFADINISYIRGVVEHEGRLYIILDVERIFAREEARGEKPAFEPAPPQGPAAGETPPVEAQRTAPTEEQEAPPAQEPAQGPTEAATSGESAVSDVGFIGEALAAFEVFYPSPINRDWLARRFEQWRAERSREEREIQLRTAEDAQAFAAPFYSPYTEAFWGPEYVESVASILPADDETAGTVNVWNPGCGKGYETYSLAVLLRRTYPQKRIKIWAVDVDLLSISTAPNLVFPATSVPDYYKDYLVEGTNGFSFSEEIKEMILFEYHDVLHENQLPEMSIILSRDLLSVLPVEAQNRVVADFGEKLKPGGIVIPGAHERLDALSDWRSIGGGVNAFTAA